MKYDEIVNAINHGEKIYNLPLRVTYYCRVSTDSDVQLNSLDNQLEYYEKYIKAKSAWTFVEGYVEEGITGVSVIKRTSFKKMIHDAKLHKFDLIITKEVSRFARDLEDSIHYIRELKTCGVGVFFENQNLSTLDENSELILNIMFNLAQDESKKLSSRVKFGHRRAVEKGHILGSSNIRGYRKDNCKLIIIEEEAKVIRKIFELYATGEYGFYKLSKKLSELGYLNKNGNLYDKDSLKKIIKNPKYKGYYRGHTYEILDYRTKRRKTIPLNEQVIYKCVDGSVPAIVSEELWDKANEVLNIRTQSYKNNNYWSGGLKYPFSSKIYCNDHNVNYQRTSSKRAVWTCRMYSQNGLKACFSPLILEEDLFNIMKIIMDKIIPKDNKIIDDMLELYNNIDRVNQYYKDLFSIEKELKKLEDKKAMTLDLVFNGDLSKEQLKNQFERYDKQLKKLIQEKTHLLKQISILKDNHHTEKLTIAIKDELEGNSVDEFTRKFVGEIIVSKIDNDRHNIKLDIFLNLFGVEQVKTRGSKYINNKDIEYSLYLKNQKYSNVGKKTNDFTYNIYVVTE